MYTWKLRVAPFVIQSQGPNRIQEFLRSFRSCNYPTRARALSLRNRHFLYDICLTHPFQGVQGALDADGKIVYEQVISKLSHYN
jgi:hypothetical protein